MLSHNNLILRCEYFTSLEGCARGSTFPAVPFCQNLHPRPITRNKGFFLGAGPVFDFAFGSNRINDQVQIFGINKFYRAAGCGVGVRESCGVVLLFAGFRQFTAGQARIVTAVGAFQDLDPSPVHGLSVSQFDVWRILRGREGAAPQDEVTY